jgi:transcriptional regulator with XRE-family HTH domain
MKGRFVKLDSAKVRWHRDRLGWTLDTLAEQAEIAEGTALRAEHGEDIRPSSGRRIARAFGVDISELVPDMPGGVPPKVRAPSSLAEWLEGRRGHAYLALDRRKIQALFDRLESVEDEDRKRRELGLAINDEYNTFCNFPGNVTPEERVAMRRMIRDAIPDVAFKHQLALSESGLWPEYQEEVKRILEVDRALSDEGQTA